MAEAKEIKETLFDVGGSLDKWIQKAMLSDLTYHRTRQELWGKLVELCKAGLKLDKALFRSVKSALCCRSEQMNDDKKLAFETALEEMTLLIEDEDADDAAAGAAHAAPKAET